MKHLRIRFTSKFEAEYFESRIFRDSMSIQKYDRNDTDTEFDVECRDIRISTFNLGQMVFEFTISYHEIIAVCCNIAYIDKFEIWCV